MKKAALLSLLALMSATLLPGQQPADRFGGTKAKIAVLLQPRLKPEALPDKPANPFQFTVTGSIAVVPTDPVPTQPTANALNDDEQILAYGVARLRITGLVLRNGISLLLINANTYKETDLIPVRATGDTVYYIRVVRIGENSVTFGYNDATLVIPLPN